MGVSRIPVELYQPDPVYGVRAVGRILAWFAAAVVLVPLLALWAGPWAAVLAFPFLGLKAHRLTQIMHECAHGSLFPGSRLNHEVGTFCGLLIGQNFEVFRAVHLLHHSTYGTPDDPEAPDYADFWTKSRRGRWAHVLRPLLLGSVSTYSVSWAALKTLPGPKRRQFLWALGIVQILLASLLTLGWRYPLLAFLYPLSLISVAPFLARVRSLAEHVPPSAESDAVFARSHDANWLDRALLYDLNTNFHAEHHHYPEVPSLHLPALSLEVSKRSFSHKPAYCMVHTVFELLRRP